MKHSNTVCKYNSLDLIINTYCSAKNVHGFLESYLTADRMKLKYKSAITLVYTVNKYCIP